MSAHRHQATWRSIVFNQQYLDAGLPPDKEAKIDTSVARFFRLDAMDDTPIDLIKAVRPDVLVKGGDWTVDKIVGSDFVFSTGGEVHSLPFRPGYSTTNIIEKIKALRDSRP